MTVVDPAATRAAVAAGAVRCPQEGCQGTLRLWSKARPRLVLMGGGRRVLVRPDRARCRACGVTQVLLPASCLPRRAYGVEVIGAALRASADGTGYRCVATTLNIPVNTVRAWIRSVAHNGSALSATAVTLVRAFGADTGPCWISGPDPVRPVRAALAALGGAAQALTQHDRRRAGTWPGSLTGIDYLGLLATRHHQDLLRRLRLSDPSHAAATAPPWHQITIITGGRLLAGTRSGLKSAPPPGPAMPRWWPPTSSVAPIGITTTLITPPPCRPTGQLAAQKPLLPSASSTTPSSARLTAPNRQGPME